MTLDQQVGPPALRPKYVVALFALAMAASAGVIAAGLLALLHVDAPPARTLVMHDTTLTSAPSCTWFNYPVDHATTLLIGDGPAVFGGFSGGVDGRILIIRADNSTIRLENEEAGAAASNRILGPNGSALILAPHSAVMIRYDGTMSRWRFVGLTGQSSEFAAFGVINYTQRFNCARVDWPLL